MPTFTIGQLAERAGVTTSSLRYYERSGLLEPVDRTPAGYRLYDETSQARLRFITRAKRLGCTLEEIADLMTLLDGDECRPVQARLHDLVTAKLAAADRQRQELAALTGQLRRAGARLGREPFDGPCNDGCACHGDDAEPPVRYEGSGGAEPVPFGLGRKPAVACTLAPEDLPDRLADWERLLGHVADRRALDDGNGLRLAFEAGAPQAELLRLTTAEQGCCTFFAFAITVDRRGLALEVRAPEQASDVLAAVFGVADDPVPPGGREDRPPGSS